MSNEYNGNGKIVKEERTDEIRISFADVGSREELDRLTAEAANSVDRFAMDTQRGPCCRPGNGMHIPEYGISPYDLYTMDVWHVTRESEPWLLPSPCHLTDEALRRTALLMRQIGKRAGDDLRDTGLLRRKISGGLKPLEGRGFYAETNPGARAAGFPHTHYMERFDPERNLYMVEARNRGLVSPRPSSSARRRG